ncbi:di/tricarboxylate transporter [Anseongella ginsenosidimutans]|uniref:Di/tricarboxylate transporter n=1 Tax=Anseongella ginsenosidimutans TaxID=496056 RepID=A0A4R3KPR0_9SPHI|nr:SLC13 family permease [Anseongella ginsenosidimutans]TCS86706.1 di/tricarboxylate transporter [Anseongella ginsenosidimutans]
MLELSPSAQQILVLTVTFLVVLALFWERIKPSVIFFGAVICFLLAGVVPTEALLESFSNESILSIFLLIFITAAVNDHFNLLGGLDRLFGNARSPRAFTLRMTSGVALISSVMNNTPIVALMIPYVYRWAKKRGLHPSRFLIPLSYAAIVGGMITVIGTSTNLVLNGLIASKGDPILEWDDFLWLGLLVTVAGVLFLYFIGYRLLPDRADVLEELNEQTREYLVETRVPPGSSLVGQSIASASLRNLKGIYLFEIARKGQVINPVAPEEQLCENDSLFFAGDTENVIELIRDGNGLMLPTAASQREPLSNVVEMVVPANSLLIGHTLKELNFREDYDAAVIAIHRNGEKLHGKIGEIYIKAGDLMLLSAGRNFDKRVNQNRILYPVSVVQKVQESSPWQRRWFIFLFLLFMGLVLGGLLDLFTGLLLVTSALVLLGLLGIADLKRHLDVELLIILASSLTFSRALIDSGAAVMVAEGVTSFFGMWGDFGVLTGLFVLTLVLTSFVTHVAAVSVVFPIAYAMCHGMGVDPTPYYVGVAFAASASFHAPFSYQTNLMVYGPGGYKFKDFLKIGIPFTLIYSVICIVFIMWYYGF